MADANHAGDDSPTSQDPLSPDAVRRTHSVPAALAPPSVRVDDHSIAQDDSPPLLDKSKKKFSWQISKARWKEWHTEFEQKGRVLIIDYVRHETSADKVKTNAFEFYDIESLRMFYNDKTRCKRSALRFVHVQNASWATRFLMRKYNINSRDTIVGMAGFARWIRYDRPEWRAGKPLLKAKAWRTEPDPWRGVSRCALGCDYLKPYEAKDGEEPSATNEEMMHNSEMMELNTYDARDEPKLGYNVHVQRFSCYIQYANGPPFDPASSQHNPYTNGHANSTEAHKPANGDASRPFYRSRWEHPTIESLDNGNAIVVFEQSNSRSCEDTLIQARNELENRWRKLSFYLSKEQLVNDDTVALHCIDYIISDLFKALSYSWEQFLSITDSHVSILEDKIYGDPADESRAEEIWDNAKNALRVEKLVYLHISVAKAMTIYLQNLTSDDEDEPKEWLAGTNDEFQRLAELVQESLMKPVTSLNDLMYKSVGIRDARQSLQLGTSMWRLSWITFIFLPLTFIVGFFGMNVDTFENNPSIKWYFIAAVPMMLLVLVLVYFLKHYSQRWRRTPYQRGIYEHFFQELAGKYPSLWTRNGPREDVRPLTTVGRLKWRLLNTWFDPKRTIFYSSQDVDEDGSSDLGTWAYVKRIFARSWLAGMNVTHEQDPFAGDTDGGYTSDPQSTVSAPDPKVGSLVTELAELSTPVFTAQGASGDTALQLAETNRARLSPLLRERLSDRRHSTGSRRASVVRPGSADSGRNSSGAMVEERDLSDDEPIDREALNRGILAETAVLSGIGAWGKPPK